MHNPYGTSTQDIGHAIHHVEKLFETVVGLVVRFEPKLPSWQQKFAAGWRARIVLPMLEWAVGTHANYTHHELSNGTPTLNHNAQALETKALFGNLRLRFRTNWTAMTSFVNIILSRIQSKTDHSLCCLPIVRPTILTTIVTNQYVEPTGHIWQFLSEWLRKRR